ncbi:MAG: bifunctional demethylmenaquinone methyltransferase/2-methoxy-6-polyprenyl-1,4-benzoquinol methylase UbiE [Planctomycetota bacterium]|nr:MAG: bifunctional demethylmenaquinone methyltransferase/2-methoxy-6-polyprenyl-1,4-benzoquinol methylase UbiE [Planctomycetota bacterium]
MFAEIAPRYDFLNHLLSAGVDIYWRRRTASRVLPLPEGPILDVCAGTGDLSFALNRRFRGKRRIVATDFCRPMLAIGRRKALKQRCEPIAWLEADTLQLPFPDDTFALVCVAFGLRNVADTDAGLAEMVRTTKPGGKVAILEFTLPRGVLGKLYAWYFHRVLPRIGQALAGNRYSAYNYLPASVSEFPQYEGLCRRMEAAGLHSAVFFPMTFGIATLYIGSK